MREIKFRGKCSQSKRWVYGWLLTNKLGTYIVTEENPHECTQNHYIEIDEYCRVDPATVGQFTGLKDKNGREIYEGNIAKVTQKNNGFYMLCKIEYEPMSFILKFKNGVKSVYKEGLDEEDFELEIIGDIHENPELLET